MSLPAQMALLLGAGVAVGFMNVLAAGGSMLSVPILIFMGLDPATAQGTNRIGLLVQNVSAVRSFRAERMREFGLSFQLGLFTLPGAIAGAVTAVKIESVLFERILAVIMIAVVVTMLLPKRKTPEEGAASLPPRLWASRLAMIGIGFYGGFIQMGIGILLMAALSELMRMDLARVNMHKISIVLVYTIPVLLVFQFGDSVRWTLGLSLAAGTAVGGWWGAKVTVRKGQRAVNYALAVVVALMALRMLDVL